MPIGIIINSLSIAIGGILGALIGGKLTEDFKDKLNMVFGVCAMGMVVAVILFTVSIGRHNLSDDDTGDDR